MKCWRPANLTPVMGWAQVVDNTGGSPMTFALNVPMEVEEVDQTRTAASHARGSMLSTPLRLSTGSPQR